MRSVNRERKQFQDRSCYGCEQRFAFNRAWPVDLHFVRGLHMDGTGYADTRLKELGSREKEI